MCLLCPSEGFSFQISLAPFVCSSLWSKRFIKNPSLRGFDRKKVVSKLFSEVGREIFANEKQ
jgi:hypothetical protein